MVRPLFIVYHAFEETEWKAATFIQDLKQLPDEP